MPEKTDYEPGTPSWVDLSTGDTAAAGTFYATLFGWEVEPLEDPEAGGYTVFTYGGRRVAAMAPLRDPSQPPAWMTYVSTDDADKVLERVAPAGGSVVMPAMDVLGAGRMGILADAAGAVIALWQPREHKGAELVDEPTAFTWTELSTGDTDAATRFYTDVFGWTAETSDGGGMAYTEFKNGDASVAGMMASPAPGMPSYWMPYFSVTDPDRSASEAAALGGSVIVEPSDFPGGRFAIVRDPQGAVFGLLRLAPRS